MSDKLEQLKDRALASLMHIEAFYASNEDDKKRLKSIHNFIDESEKARKGLADINEVRSKIFEVLRYRKVDDDTFAAVAAVLYKYTKD